MFIIQITYICTLISFQSCTSQKSLPKKKANKNTANSMFSTDILSKTKLKIGHYFMCECLISLPRQLPPPITTFTLPSTYHYQIKGKHHFPLTLVKIPQSSNNQGCTMIVYNQSQCGLWLDSPSNQASVRTFVGVTLITGGLLGTIYQKG